MTADLFEELNPEQREAVLHARGPLLVLAGAGSGKTRVVTRRLARLVGEGEDPRRIVAVTFTNKAAREMRERVASLLGEAARQPFIGTFHAWGLRLLRRRAGEAGLKPGFSVADTGDQIAIVRAAMAQEGWAETESSAPALLSRISALRTALAAEPQEAGSGEESRLVRLAGLYEQRLREAGSVDFDDLLLLPLRLLRERPAAAEAERASVAHLLIDEYQDTNAAQRQLVQLLAAEADSLCAVGDEDQSIYAWRGAQIEHILSFERDFPGARVLSLTRNYRSTASILAAAGGLVARNRRRRGKTLVAEGEAGAPVEVRECATDREEASWAAARTAASAARGLSAAVLVRTNAQTRLFEEELVRRGVPYTVLGAVRFYDRAEVRDALAYLRLALDPADDLAFRRVVNTPARGIGAATLDLLGAHARERGISLYAASLELPGATERARMALARFRELVDRAGDLARKASPAEVLGFLLRESGYAAMYEGSREVEDAARRENLAQLAAAARDFAPGGEGPSLREFLDRMALAGDAGAAGEAGVRLATLHAAKGLEFDEVIVAGLEEGYLPHPQSGADPDEIEEERRLLYVGMTRARKMLALTHARRRTIHGEWRPRDPSRFLDELPEEGVVRTGLPAEAPLPETPAGRDRVLGPSVRLPHGGPGARDAAPRRRVSVPGTLPGLSRGQRVRHPTYGAGVILQQEGSGDDARLTVYFDRAGRKKFVAKFARLTPA